MSNDSNHWYDRSKGVPPQKFNEAAGPQPTEEPGAGSDMIKKSAPALISRPKGPGARAQDALTHGDAMRADDAAAQKVNEERRAEALERLRDEDPTPDRDDDRDR